ncbi:hypothetical protein M9H77_23500 [Catharanthus roseus]|uniref:Uncharacterized protein n=1 Tax=Catharanthus roseus TaxID=4058 RepID=A0ACC0AUQ2_CATRO|nr:hypothetical protein M9H77_23500 [Catharanthus roseus]
MGEEHPTTDGSPTRTVVSRLLPVKLMEDYTLLRPYIEGFARRFQSRARDVEELKKARVVPQWSKELEIIMKDLTHLTIKDLLIIYLIMDNITCRFKILIHSMKVDIKEGHKLELKEDGFRRKRIL